MLHRRLRPRPEFAIPSLQRRRTGGSIRRPGRLRRAHACQPEQPREDRQGAPAQSGLPSRLRCTHRDRGGHQHRRRLLAGSTVAVIGCGGVGLPAIQGARLAHARRIVAVDIDDAKLDLARALRRDRRGQRPGDRPDRGRSDPDGRRGRPRLRGDRRRPTVQQGLAMAGMGGTLTVVGIVDPADQPLLQRRRPHDGQDASNNR